MTEQKQDEKRRKKREYYQKNIERSKEIAKKSREKHKERRRLDQKLWLEKNKEYSAKYHREYHKAWYVKNKEKKDSQNKEWARNNPEKSKEIKRRFDSDNPELVKIYLSRYIKTDLGKYRTLKGSAVKRNYGVEITFEQYCEITSKPCVYCGESKERIGIDRIENTKGYTLENSAPSCTPCNMMKKTMSVQEFLERIKKIYNHNY